MDIENKRNVNMHLEVDHALHKIKQIEEKMQKLREETTQLIFTTRQLQANLWSIQQYIQGE